MQTTKARLHIVTTVPPGYSLVGAMPHGLFRLERIQLADNPRLSLVSCYGSHIPFDGGSHVLSAEPGGARTLAIGAHVSLCVLNSGVEPEPLDVQVLGATVDGPEGQEGEPAPELGHTPVIGIIPQEAVIESYRDSIVPSHVLLAHAADHYAAAVRRQADAFQVAALSGSIDDWCTFRDREREVFRFTEMVRYAQSMVDGEPKVPETIPAPADAGEDARFAEFYTDESDPYGMVGLVGNGDESTLGLSPEQWTELRLRLKQKNGWSDEELDAHLADIAAHPEKRASSAPAGATHVGGAGFTFSDE